MRNWESLENLEQRNGLERDFPENHLENMKLDQLEKMSPTDAAKEIGRNVFQNSVVKYAGDRGAFMRLEKEGNADVFGEYYSKYVNHPETLRSENPEMYKFMQDRVFFGREYEGKDGAGEGILPKTQIVDSRIENCDDPFSYGDVEKMSEKLDAAQGDTGLIPIAASRMVACRNLMALCGHKFTEGEVTSFAVDHEYMAYDPMVLGGFSHELDDMILPDIIRGMSNIETYEPNILEAENAAEAMADLLDHGQRGLVVYNAGILNRTPMEAEQPFGKIMENLPFISANQASVLECAVRDGSTGEVRGFYICDSEAKEPQRYVEADRLLKALDVKNSTILFTKEAYLDE
ncbi:MAG: hypothetical protein IJ315_09535 [Firmicutes bacterium]|nr:hypothetical protein [Bacillota bacterium]